MLTDLLDHLLSLAKWSITINIRRILDAQEFDRNGEITFNQVEVAPLLCSADAAETMRRQEES